HPRNGEEAGCRQHGSGGGMMAPIFHSTPSPSLGGKDGGREPQCRGAQHPLPTSPSRGEVPIWVCGTMASQPPLRASLLDGEARWGWSHTHHTAISSTKEQSHG